MIALLIVAGLFGACIGSFLNVVAHRLPRGESIVHPPSRCYACGTRIAWHDNLPLLGWLILRGRCRWCGTAFSPRYLIVEVLAAALTMALVHRLCGEDAPGIYAGVFVQWPEVVLIGLALTALLVPVWLLLVAALIDLRWTIIPDEIAKPLQVLAPLLALALPIDLLPSVIPDAWLVRPSLLPGVAAVLDPSPALMWAWSAWGLSSLLLLLSLPLARRIYDRFAAPGQAWRPEDHRAFRVGVLWFLVSLLPLLLLVTALAWPAFANDGLSHARLLWLHQGCQAVLGAILGWWLLYGIGLIGTVVARRNAMGFGDVKILAPIGALLGPSGLLAAFGVAVLSAAAVGLPRRLRGGSSEIPFGPFLVVGAIAALWVAQPLHRFVVG